MVKSLTAYEHTVTHAAAGALHRAPAIYRHRAPGPARATEHGATVRRTDRDGATAT